MKRLLPVGVPIDENIPVQFREYFDAAFDVYTIRYMGWSSLEDSDLLTAMQEAKFDMLITVDKRLHMQHDLSQYSFSVITLLTYSNRLDALLPFVPLIEQWTDQSPVAQHTTLSVPA